MTRLGSGNLISATIAIVVVVAVWIWLAVQNNWRPDSWRPFLALGCAGVLAVAVYRALTRGLRG